MQSLFESSVHQKHWYFLRYRTYPYKLHEQEKGIIGDSHKILLLSKKGFRSHSAQCKLKCHLNFFTTSKERNSSTDEAEKISESSTCWVGSNELENFPLRSLAVGRRSKKRDDTCWFLTLLMVPL